MTLSVFLVTRNHEASLPAAVRSAAVVADEVLVLDTGSTDNTVAAARALGARVEPFAWDDDFAAACNAAIDGTTGDWLLLLNPDEELLSYPKELLAPTLARRDLLAGAVRVAQVTRPDAAPPFVETAAVRLFRRDAGLRYAGRLHPHFDPTPQAVAAAQGRRVEEVDLVLRHHAYLSTPTPDKLRWTLRLLERELADRPGRLHYLIEYGLTLRQLQDRRALDILAEVAGRLDALRDAPTPPTANAAPLLEFLLSAADAPPVQADVEALALRWFPRAPALLWRLAERRFQARNYAGAAELLERVLMLGETESYDRTMPFDPDLLGEAALRNLTECRRLDAARPRRAASAAE